MRKNNTYIIMLILFLTILMLSIFNGRISNEVNQFIETLSTAVAIIGVIAIWYQLKRDKDINEAQFIFDLNSKFYENEYIMKVYRKCINDYQSGQFVEEFSEKDEFYVGQFFSFFGIMNTLIEKGILDLKIISRTFSYRYFIVANHPEIQKLFLIKDSQYYRGNYSLYKKWYEYRKENGEEVIYDEHNLLITNPGAFD